MGVPIKTTTIYAKDGTAYVGEPVDCRELLQTGAYTVTPPTPEAPSAPAAVQESTPVTKAPSGELVKAAKK